MSYLPTFGLSVIIVIIVTIKTIVIIPLTVLMFRLIATGCPARSDVSLHWDEGSSNSAFSFKVSSNLKSKVG